MDDKNVPFGAAKTGTETPAGPSDFEGREGNSKSEMFRRFVISEHSCGYHAFSDF
jgi:hypothetical protein